MTEEETLKLQTEFKALADESVERLNEELKDIKLSKPTYFKRYFIEQRICNLENEARKHKKELQNQFLFMVFLSVMFFFFMMYVMFKIKGY